MFQFCEYNDLINFTKSLLNKKKPYIFTKGLKGGRQASNSKYGASLHNNGHNGSGS